MIARAPQNRPTLRICGRDDSSIQRHRSRRTLGLDLGFVASVLSRLLNPAPPGPAVRPTSRTCPRRPGHVHDAKPVTPQAIPPARSRERALSCGQARGSAPHIVRRSLAMLSSLDESGPFSVSLGHLCVCLSYRGPRRARVGDLGWSRLPRGRVPWDRGNRRIHHTRPT